jgi:actin related protein 2/3 complex subunit 2
MILLDYHNRIVKQTIEARIELAGRWVFTVASPCLRSLSDKKEVLDVTLADFDGVQMHITTDANDKNLLTVSLAWRCAKDLLKNGGQEYLQSVYGGLLSAQPETSYDVTLNIDLNQEAPGTFSATYAFLTEIA